MTNLLLSVLSPNPVGQGFVGGPAASPAYVTAFRMQFPAFSNSTAYPDAQIEMFSSFAGNYLSFGNCSSLTASQQSYALNLMTAHLLQLNANAASGLPAGFVTAESVKDVSFSVAAPPSENGQFQWWLNLTGYGSQLYSLLDVLSVGGMYYGGSPTAQIIRNGSYGWGSW